MNSFERHHESSLHPKFPLISRPSRLVSLSSPKCNHWETDSNRRTRAWWPIKDRKECEAHFVILSPQRRVKLWKETAGWECAGQVTSSDTVNCSHITSVLRQHTTDQITKGRTRTSRKPAAGLKYILSAAGRSSEQPQTLRRMVQGFNSWLGTFPGAHFSPCPKSFDNRLTVNQLF